MNKTQKSMGKDSPETFPIYSTKGGYQKRMPKVTIPFSKLRLSDVASN